VHACLSKLHEPAMAFGNFAGRMRDHPGVWNPQLLAACRSKEHLVPGDLPSRSVCSCACKDQWPDASVYEQHNNMYLVSGLSA
jgi:hypothetical protein